jgi:hypothetical protein
MTYTHRTFEDTLLEGEDLIALMQGTGQKCLTLLCPLHPSNPDRSTDRLTLKHLMQQAALLIQSNWEKPIAEVLLQKLEHFQTQIDLVHTSKGLGIYISANHQRVIRYPFTVPPMVFIDLRFPVRESLWQLQISQPVYVINLSEHEIKLEVVRDGQWEPVVDSFFPFRIIDDFEYSKPVRSSSYAGHAHVKIFEKDKSELQQIRFRDAFKKTDAPLNTYLKRGAPLIIAGPDRDMSLFQQVSAFSGKVIGEVSGNYQIDHPEHYRDKVMHLIQEYRQQCMQKTVSKFLEKWGAGMARCGLSDCWRSVSAGQGLELLVERGYREPVFEDRVGVFTKDKTAKSTRWVVDAIDELMEKTIQKGGAVTLVENNMLASAQRIALILRYPANI